LKCSGIWRKRYNYLSEIEDVVKMKSRIGGMVWMVLRGDEGED